VSGHVATRHRLLGVWAEENGFVDVNSYHNQAIVDATLSKAVTAIAESGDGVIEALKHKTFPWLGIMWHPEREETPAENDRALLKKHFGSEK